jgi:hypothetical protein
MQAVGEEGIRFQPWDLDSSRENVWRTSSSNGRMLWKWLMTDSGARFVKAFGLVLDGAPRTVYHKNGKATVEVHSVRTSQRRSGRGQFKTDLVVELMQRRRGYFEAEDQEREDAPGQTAMPIDVDGDFKFRAGCTVIIDPIKGCIRRVIRTAATVADDRDVARVGRYLTGADDEPGNAFRFGRPASLALRSRDSGYELFAMLHRHEED